MQFALPSRRTTDLMRKFSMILAALVFLAILATAFHGCAANQSAPRKAFIGVDAATDVVEGVNTAYETHLITKDQLRALVPYADAVKLASDRVDQAILDKNLTVDTYRDALNLAVMDLLNRQAAAKKATAASTPSTAAATRP